MGALKCKAEVIWAKSNSFGIKFETMDDDITRQGTSDLFLLF